MKLIQGKKIADKILSDLEKKIVRQETKPGLAVIWVGNDPASKIYINLKKKSAEKIGMKFSLFRFDEKSTGADVISKIRILNQDKNTHGIIVQLPLPKKFSTEKIIRAIDPQKDADGFHPRNVELFLRGREKIFPVFPKAIIKMIGSVPENKKIREAIILTRSKLFGKVMKEALSRKKIKSKMALIKGKIGTMGEEIINGTILKKADLIVTAVGIPKFIRGDMVKNKVIIIDGGIKKIGRKIYGDADLESIKKIAKAVSPVPGGVGPVTVATLIENVIELSKTKP